MVTTTNTRQRIISAAQELIYARSYNNVGVQEICDHAGVKKGSFYHFFPSKRELALAVLDQLQDFVRETIINKSFVDDIPPLARIERFFTTLYEFHKQVKANSGTVLGCPFGNFGSEMSTQDEDIRSKVDHILGASEKPFEKALEEAIERGDLPAIDGVTYVAEDDHPLLTVVLPAIEEEPVVELLDEDGEPLVLDEDGEPVYEKREAYHAWFAGVAPLDDPKYVIVVVVDQGGSGGQVAAPTARRIMQYLMGEKMTPITAGSDSER